MGGIAVKNAVPGFREATDAKAVPRRVVEGVFEAAVPLDSESGIRDLAAAGPAAQGIPPLFFFFLFLPGEKPDVRFLFP